MEVGEQRPIILFLKRNDFSTYATTFALEATWQAVTNFVSYGKQTTTLHHYMEKLEFLCKSAEM